MPDKPNITILNVNDHDDSRYTVTQMLKQAGFEVIEAANGAEALRLVKENPDLIVLDVNLPDTDGFEVCRRFKADHATSQIPVLFLSATYDDDRSRLKGLESGADGYLTQPIEPQVLIAYVKSLLRMQQAEVKACASEEKLAGIIDSVTDQMIMLDEEFNIVWANNVAKTMMGSNIIGKKCYNKYSETDALCEQCIVRQCFEDGKIHEFEKEIVRADGEHRYFSCTASVAARHIDGRPKMVVDLLHDITDQKNKEVVLRQRSEKLSVLYTIAAAVSASIELDEMLDIALSKVKEMLKVDFALIYIYKQTQELALKAHHGVSQQFIRNMGLLPEEFGMPHKVVQSDVPILVENIMDNPGPWRKALAGEKIISFVIIPLKSKDMVNGTIVMGYKAHHSFTSEFVMLLIGIGHQIGVAIENARLYAEIKNFSRKLEIKVEERTKELKGTQAQLIQAGKLAAIGQLAGGVAHEINNPLSGVLGFSTSLLKEVDNEELKKVEAFRDFPEYLSLIRQSAVRCKHITSKLLGFARQTNHAAVPTDITMLIEDILSLMGHQISIKNIKIIKEFELDLLMLECDINQLQQVFLNMILNASDAMPSGGELTISIKKHATDGKHIAVSFKDTGEGILPENLDKIFEPFFTTRETGKGTGLGLSVSYGIIKEHGGSIEVKSEVGKGSTFTIVLPVISNAECGLRNAECGMIRMRIAEFKKLKIEGNGRVVE